MGTNSDGAPENDGQVITLPEITITGRAPQKPMDPHGVIVDGVVKPPNVPVNLSGTVTGVSTNAQTRLTTVTFEDRRNNKRAISFIDPIGTGPDGAPIHHPLAEMVATMEKNGQRDLMRVALDGKGNTDFAVANKENLDRGHAGPALPTDLAPGDKRMPAPDREFIKQLGDVVHQEHLESEARDRAQVEIEGVSQNGKAVSISGTIVGVQDKNGVKTMTYELADGQIKHLSFNDPAGMDAKGQPIPSPLSSFVKNAEQRPGGDFRLDIDAQGLNQCDSMTGPLPDRSRLSSRRGPDSEAFQAGLDAKRKPLEPTDAPAGHEPPKHAPQGTTMESLLKPSGPDIKGTDGQTYVQLGHPVGSLRVEKSLFADFKTAEMALGKSQEAVDTLNALTNPPKRDSGHWYQRDSYPEPIEMRRGATVADDHFWPGADGKHPEIVWAPNGGLGTPNGTQAPFMPLFHETGHAIEWQQHPERSNRNSQDYPVGSADAKRWTTPEENRNEVAERRVATELGQPLRFDHGGSIVQTKGPLSREPAAELMHVSPSNESLATLPPLPTHATVIGKESPNGVSIEGTIASVTDRDGIKQIAFRDAQGKESVLRFPDPVGFDENGKAQANPLGHLAGEFQYNAGQHARIDIDPSGRNVVAAIGAETLKLGPQANEFEQKLHAAHDAGDRGPAR